MVIIVISVFVGLSCLLGIFVLVKIQRLRRQRFDRTQGPPILPEVSVTSTLNFPSFRTQNESNNSVRSSYTDSLEPNDSASFGPYQRTTSHVYLNVRTASPALISPALASSTMSSWEDLEQQRPDSEMHSMSSNGVTEYTANRSPSSFSDMMMLEQERLRVLSGQAWITRKPSQGQLGK